MHNETLSNYSFALVIIILHTRQSKMKIEMHTEVNLENIMVHAFLS